MVMFRVAYILLTVAGILACPFKCMAKVGAQGVPAEQRAGCSCCQHSWQDPAGGSGFEASPVEPQRRGPAYPEDCDCICLCRGAVETVGGPQPGLGEQAAFTAWLDSSLITQADAASSSFPSLAEGSPPPEFCCGRMIRLALASLLL